MSLSWNQIRINAKKFAKEWATASYEKGQSQTFYNEFFEVFGQRRRNVAMYENKVKLLDNRQGFIDLFWPGTLLVEQKSAGRDLDKAITQADDYILALKERERPRYRLVCDFQNFIFADLETRETHHFKLSELPEKIRLFDFIAGRPKQVYRDQDPANIVAAAKMSNLHKLLEDAGYAGHDLERLLVRIMFCLFADDTGIFEPDSFLRYIEDRTHEDGSDCGSRLVELFQVLDTAMPKRQSNLDEDLAAFPYVNGQLFRDNIRIPSFNPAMRQALLECCYFNWSKVSPALFGSLFQTVMLPAEQRQKGAHYTSEKNILKTIHPLFLDDLWDEFNKIKDDRGTQRVAKLKKFHDKLASLTFFDPACGCGNFLILAYRELRELELALLDLLYPPKDESGVRQLEMDVSLLSRVDVDQFFGIEIAEFPARIAETAMWLVDHQMNMRLGEVFGVAFARLPLQKAAHIHHHNALQMNWADVLLPEKCGYILGNPPFIGHHLQTETQKDELNAVLHEIQASGVMDYVSAWFMKAAQYIQHTDIKVAFVATNSITQGEQVGILWSVLCRKYGIKILFAHRTFKWTIDERRAQGMRIAAVYVVIIGFAVTETDKRQLFEYETITSDPHKIIVNHINPYLANAPDAFVTNRTDPICQVPDMMYGSKPTDGGNFIFSDEERRLFLDRFPQASKFIKKYLGGEEFLHAGSRWVLWLVDANPHELEQYPEIKKRIEAVKNFRLASKAATTRNYPYHTLFRQITQPQDDYILVPRTTSENRDYIPLGFFSKDDIIGDTCQSIPNATLYHFGVISSIMHMAWVRSVCGRLKGDYRYSKDIVYNNFPWPDMKPEQEKDIAAKAQAILDARAQFPDSTLADLYNPTTMPVPLRQAHLALDKAVDKAYRREAFANELERIQFLFARYQELVEPLTAKLTQPKTRKRKTHA